MGELLIIQLILFVVEIVLLILFDKKNGNRKFRICVMTIIVLQIGAFCYDRYYRREHPFTNGVHCSESICGTEVDKNGFVKCKYLDYDNVEHEIKCPAPEKY